jgi:hypothetical protein
MSTTSNKTPRKAKNLKKSLSTIILTLTALIMATFGLACPPPVEPEPIEVPKTIKVQGVALTNEQRPTWTWTTSPKVTNLRYRILPEVDSWIRLEKGVQEYTPDWDLGNMGHTFQIQASYDGKHWSKAGSFVTVVDTLAPAAPTLIGTDFTKETYPMWSWQNSPDTVASRYRLNQGDWVLIDDSAVNTFRPNSALEDGTHAFEVQIQDSTGNWSASSVYETVVDTVAPKLPVITAPTFTQESQPTWTWTVDEAISSYDLKLNDTPWHQGAEAANLTYTPVNYLSEGTHTLYLRVYDLAGNASDVAQESLIIDQTPPATPLLTAPSRSNMRKPTWSWVLSEDTLRVYYRFRGESWQSTNGEGSTGYTPEVDLADGEYTLEVYSEDAAGNASIASSRRILIDATAPPTPILSGTDYTRSSLITWNWAEPDVDCDLEYRVNGGDWVEAARRTYSYSISNPDEGSYLFEMRAVDNYENYSSIASFTTVVDYTAPEAPVIIAPAVTNDVRPTFQWEWPEDVIALRYWIDSNSSQRTTDSDFTSYAPDYDLNEGTHTFTLRYEDRAGNISSNTSYVIEIDLTAPYLSSISNRSYLIAAPYSWSWTTNSDADILEARLADGEWTEIGGPGTNSYTIGEDLPDGEYTLSIRARDLAGNYSLTRTDDFIVDQSPPEVPVITAVPESTEGYIDWSWTNPESLRAYITVNGQYQTSGVGTKYRYYVNGEGNYTITVQLQDLAGNTSEGSHTAFHDNVPPSILSLEGQDSTNNSTPTWLWSFSPDTTQFRYRINDGDWTEETDTSILEYTPDEPLADGTYRFELRVGDRLDNYSTPRYFTTRIDTTPPDIPVITWTEQTYSSRPIWSWTSSNATDFVLNINGVETVLPGDTSSYRPSTAEPLSEGPQSFSLIARDALGNASEAALAPVFYGPLEPELLHQVQPYFADRARMVWEDNSAFETEYRIYRSEPYENDPLTLLATLPADSTTYDDLDVEHNSRYEYHVIASTGTFDSQNSYDSREDYFVAGPPEFELNLSHYEYDDAIVINCSSSSIIDSLKFERKLANETEYTVIQDGDHYSYRDRDVVEMEEYDYRVTSTNEYGQVVKEGRILRIPFGINLFGYEYNALTGAVDLDWSNPSAVADSFQIQRSDAWNAPFAVVGTVPVDTLTFSDNTVEEDSTYYYRIVPVANGTLGMLHDRQVDTYIKAPINFAYELNSNGGVTLTWDSDTSVEIDHFQLTVSDRGYSAEYIDIPSTARSYEYNNLQEGRTHTFALQHGYLKNGYNRYSGSTETLEYYLPSRGMWILSALTVTIP